MNKRTCAGGAVSACVALSVFLLLSCGVGVGPEPKPGSGTGSVALFITDNISMYKQVVTTITSVRLVNTATGGVCAVLGSPVTYDIANLTDRAQYASLAVCPEGRYNRIDVEFQAAVHLMDELGAVSACTYASFSREDGEQRQLACDPATGTCTVSIQSGRRGMMFVVQEDRYNDLGIDFDLKKFTVSGFGDPATCAVNMKLTAASAAEMNESGRAHSVTGGIQDLDTANKAFRLLATGTTLTVGYAGIVPALQQNIDDLLQQAAAGGMAVSVLTGRIDLETGTVAANRVLVKAAGVAGQVQAQPRWTFDLATGSTTSLTGSFRPPADVQGAFADGSWVNVKFDGYDTARSRYIASSIEVLPAGTMLAD